VYKSIENNGTWGSREGVMLASRIGRCKCQWMNFILVVTVGVDAEGFRSLSLKLAVGKQADKLSLYTLQVPTSVSNFHRNY
jgi:hypothetical protein